ncbi:MAG: hypothetical protein FJ004_04255 [Chloroflexi bacterium]|nr:hypothetical protein [Chloroflexota bacterium]
MAEERRETGLNAGVKAEQRDNNLTRVLVVLNLAFVAVLLYILSVLFAYPVFQSTRLTDPLAEINSLSPLYYAAIALTALLIVCCVLWRIGNKYLHLFLLMLFAIMLWLTPYLLTSFVRLGDSPWHTGVAMSIPQVLDGVHVSFSGYGWYYPISYIYHYSAVNILGIQPLTYIGIYPLFCLLLFVFLVYLLTSRMFNQRTALLAVLLTIPGLHYLQLHTSPHTMGALLMLTALLMLIQRGAARKTIPLVMILTVIVIATHPTTPLLLSIFLAAALLTDVIYSRRITGNQIAIAGVFLLCFVGWFLWYSYYPAPPWFTGEVSGLVGYIFPEELGTAGEYVGGTPFIYSNIYNLNKAIYYLYAIAALLGILYLAASNYSRGKGVRQWALSLGGLKRSEACLCISILPLAFLTFLLAERAHDLIETGLTYLILGFSCVIASAVVRSRWINKKIASFAVVAGVLFLTMLYPIVAYSIDAYSSFPESEKRGVEFLDSKVPLDGKTVGGTNVTQLALYPQASSAEIKYINYRRKQIYTDVALLRNTGYYYMAMRFARSFENNAYTSYQKMIEDGKYNKVYTSPTCNIYLKYGGTQ